MRITIVQGPFLPVPPLLGGAVEKAWFALGKEFARQGHQVVHLSRAHPKLPREEAIEGVRHRRVSGFASPATFSRRMLCDFWYALRTIPRLPPADILVTNTFWLPALERRQSRGRGYVHVARYPKGQMKLYRRAILQTVSEPIRAAILAEDPSAAGRVRVIPYPVSPLYLRQDAGTAAQTVLYTGRVHPEKGVHLLIEAFSRLQRELREKWHLKIVGPWEIAYGGGGENYQAELKNAASSLAGRVEFVGREFDEARLIAHYRDASLFVYPSLAERGETFGLAVLEAMASGCAPIVSSLGCFRDFVKDGVNGRIFDHRENGAVNLAATMTACMTDLALTERIRHAAWDDARNFTLPAIADRFLDDFSRLIP